MNALVSVRGDIVAEAKNLPKNTKEQREIRKYDIQQAKAIVKSGKLIKKNYPGGLVKPNENKVKAAYAMPDNSRAENKSRNQAIKEAEKELDLYYKTIAPYAAAQKLVHSFENRDEVVRWAEANYDKACEVIKAREEEESKKAKEKKHLTGRRSK